MELAIRWEKIRKAMEQVGADACLLSTPVNVYYTCGHIIIGYVYIPMQGDPTFMVRRPNNIVGEHFHLVRKLEDLPALLAAKGQSLPNTLLVEGDDISYGDWMRIEKCTGAKLINGSKVIRYVKSVKTAFEQEQLRLSGKKHTEVMEKVPSLYRAGMTDHEFSVEVERLFRLNGCLGLFRIYGSTMESHMGSVLSGDNAGTPSPYDFALGGGGMHSSLPLGANNSVIKEGQTVMVDINGNFTGYVTDQSRTYSVGKLPQLAYDAHNVSIEIQAAIAQAGVPGATCEQMWQLSLDIVQKYHLDAYYMGTTQQAKFVGHGIGMEINELPVLCGRNPQPLEAGNTIALEPKFVIPGVGAVGTENSYIVTENGMEKITFAPEEIIQLD